jgi:hypothetical protein
MLTLCLIIVCDGASSVPSQDSGPQRKTASTCGSHIDSDGSKNFAWRRNSKPELPDTKILSKHGEEFVLLMRKRVFRKSVAELKRLAHFPESAKLMRRHLQQ